jgi:hypothetical protein
MRGKSRFTSTDLLSGVLPFMALYIHPAIDIEIESAHMLQPRIFCMRPRLEICSVCVIFQ